MSFIRENLVEPTRIIIELNENSSQLVPFNEFVVVIAKPIISQKSRDEEVNDNVFTVWPKCSGTIQSISGVSPSTL